ncbi:MAG: hypothetical protein GAK36_00107 [Pseudomonas sp.]|nr:MAG: hypothetical protein GAK36_00107 [Pseudomonas sp.]
MTLILNSLDALLCLLVAGAAAEYLRKIHPTDHPALCLAFYLVAIGAFGGLAQAIHGAASIPSVLMHCGVALYAWVRRHHVFDPAGATTN